MDLEYRYSATQNNGQIAQSKDWLSGEEVTYAYDSLNRLIGAVTTGPEWGLSFSYDGFGNRLGQAVAKGSAPMSSLVVDAAINRIVGSWYGYDANGNAVSVPTAFGPRTLSYDVENRLVSAPEQYAYGPRNERVWKKDPTGNETVYYYGPDGRKLGEYLLSADETGLHLGVTQTFVYFGGQWWRRRPERRTVRTSATTGRTAICPTSFRRSIRWRRTGWAACGCGGT